jgi:hypothetical protein
VLSFAPLPLLAQSTHLLALEWATPATSAGGLSSIAQQDWGTLWLNPAADPLASGFGAGLERNSFGAVRTLTAQGAFRLGPRWSISLAQTSVSDLFEPELLEEDPTLAQLGAMALTLGLDGAIVLGSASGASAGLRLARDELLGESTTGWIARVGAAVRVPLDVRLAATAERMLGGNIGPPASGRARVGASRQWGAESARLSVGVGAEVGGLWTSTQDYAAAAASLSLLLAKTLTIGGSIGRERDLYAADAWLHRATAWLGVTVGPINLQFRLGSQTGPANPALAAAASFTPNRRP